MDGYADRAEAGRRLARPVADALGAPAQAPEPPPVVLGLPRGGVPVAAAVASKLSLSLDVLLVRKLGVPDRPELAFGAIASGGVRVLNPDVLAATALDERAIAAVAEAEARELARRERVYRGATRPPPSVHGRTAVVVDDGLATGATMRAAVMALRALEAARVIAAAPVGSDEACELVAEVADALVCPLVPKAFRAVGAWYADFEQVDDDDVRRVLGFGAQGEP